MTFFTSDLHLGHDKNFLYEPRNFHNILDHDAAVITNWNAVVSKEDEVYVLGDLMLNNNERGLQLLSLLNGKIHIIRGNHDTDARWNLYNTLNNVVEMAEGKFFKYKKYNFYLSHYPCICENRDNDKPLKAKMISLCGHSHTKDSFADWDRGFIYHVELDAHNNFPISIDSIIEDIKNKIKQ